MRDWTCTWQWREDNQRAFVRVILQQTFSDTLNRTWYRWTERRWPLVSVLASRWTRTSCRGVTSLESEPATLPFFFRGWSFESETRSQMTQRVPSAGFDDTIIEDHNYTMFSMYPPNSNLPDPWQSNKLDAFTVSKLQ